MDRSKLELYVSKISGQQLTAYASLGVCDAVRATRATCSVGSAAGAFLSAVGSNAQASLVMSLARALDDHKDSIGVRSVCNYAEQHSEECAWLFSGPGIRMYPNGRRELRERCVKWRAWAESHGLKHDIELLRDKVIAHSDKATVSGLGSPVDLPLRELRPMIEQLGGFVDDFRQLISNSQTHTAQVYEEALRTGVIAFACAEATYLRAQTNTSVRLWPGEVSPIMVRINDEAKKGYE